MHELLLLLLLLLLQHMLQLRQQQLQSLQGVACGAWLPLLLVGLLLAAGAVSLLLRCRWQLRMLLPHKLLQGI
jgi:hypothetical protein